VKSVTESIACRAAGAPRTHIEFHAFRQEIIDA